MSAEEGGNGPADDKGDGSETDPEDASEAGGWSFPTDLNRWLAWAGIGVTLVAALQLFSGFLYDVFVRWGYPASSTANSGFRPSGYYSLVLLLGVGLLVLTRSTSELSPQRSRLRAICCIATSTGAALVAAQLIAAAQSVFPFLSPRSLVSPTASVSLTVSRVFYGLSGLGDAILSAFATCWAIALYRWARDSAAHLDAHERPVE